MVKCRCLVYSLILGMFGFVYSEYAEARKAHNIRQYKKCVKTDMEKVPACAGVAHSLVYNAPHFATPYAEVYIEDDSKPPVSLSKALEDTKEGEYAWDTEFEKQLTRKQTDCYYHAAVAGKDHIFKSCCKHYGTWHDKPPGGLKFMPSPMPRATDVGYCDFKD